MISCVYCGGEHARPADVRQCWAEHESGDAAGSEPTSAVTPARPETVAPAASAVPAEPTESLPAVAVEARRGPPGLGRHVVVAAGEAPPADWSDCDRLEIDGATLADPAAAVATLRAAAQRRTGLVLSVDVGTELDPSALSVDAREPFEVGVEHTFALDDLRALVTANAIDARGGAGRWTLVDAAVAGGAFAIGGAGDASGADPAGDIVTPDGRAVWLDGGPPRFTPPVEGVDVVHAVQIEHGTFLAPRSNDTAADLAPDQLGAVTHPGGTARIIAPAGSGKTRVLTERARHLLTEWRVPASALTLVAFNKRAQEEMLARTADLPGLHVRTLNAIALAIVNGTEPFAPQRRRWRTIDEPDVRRLLGSLVQRPRKLNIDPLAPWIDALGLVRLGLVDPATAELRYGGDVDGLADVWPRFRAGLDRDGVVDFDDQIYRAIEVLLTDPAARRAAQRACRLLLVDEFQDLTPAHVLLIRLLAAPSGAVFGVGDDDQTIYGYNGADPRWLIDFDHWFPGAESLALEVNYRCPAGVVEIADRLLRHNRRRVDKTIRAASTDGEGWLRATSDDPVAETVAAVVRSLDASIPASDVAVLTRVNAALVPVQAGLAAAGVGFSGGVGGDFADRTAVRAALAWIRLAGPGPFSGDDVGEALRRPSRGLSPRLRDWAAEQRDLDGLERLAARLTNDRDAEKVAAFAVDLARLTGMVRRGEPTAAVLAALIDEIGLGGAVATLDRGRQGMNRSAQGDDLRALRQLGRMHDRADTFERWLTERLMARRDPAGVVLSTVHRVKGQEWPHVVAHLVDGDQYPHRLADDIEEERRLLHVAITRGRQHVTIVSGDEPSPFLPELTTEPPEHPPEPPPAPSVARVTRPSEQRAVPDHPLLDRSRVIAVPGLVLVDQGQDWTITELEPEAAVASHGDSTRRFRLGAKVETSGKQRGELGPRPGDVDEASALAFDLLRSFRDQARDGKPAYTVFDDKTLAGIATALPVDHGELARVKGVGPAKLDRYGDDVLDVVAAARHAT